MIKKMAILSFTAGGKSLGEKLSLLLSKAQEEVRWKFENVHRPIPLDTWMKEHFEAVDALVFIGAMGIIVRGMAPYLRGKTLDPAVVVLDENGQFAISVLSGHLGGANALTAEISNLLGAVPVITTASDVNQKIAIDVFAKKNYLVIDSMKQAKQCAAAIVSGEKVSFQCEGNVFGKVPAELASKPEEASFQVHVTPRMRQKDASMLHLIPKAYVLGVGCKAGTPEHVIAQRFREELDALGIDLRSIDCMASIDLKRYETGLLDFSKKQEIPIRFFSAEKLLKLPGNFTSSEFVSQVTGVDNVCERSAFGLIYQNETMKPEDYMVLPKSGKDGVTIAIMKKDWSVSFE